MTNPYTTYHSYDIEEMLDRYEVSELKIDDTLAMFMLLKILSLYERDRGRISEETMYNKYLVDLLNLYNQNKETINDSDKETVGTIENAL